MNTSGKIVLHVLRTDILLHALGGMGEEERIYRTPYTLLTNRQIRAIRRQATQTTEYGTLRDLARSLELSYETLKTMIWRVRHRTEPQCWRYVT